MKEMNMDMEIAVWIQYNSNCKLNIFVFETIV